MDHELNSPQGLVQFGRKLTHADFFLNCSRNHIVAIIRERFINAADKNSMSVTLLFYFSIFRHHTVTTSLNILRDFHPNNYTNQGKPFWSGRRILFFRQRGLNGMLSRRSFHKLQLSPQSSDHSIHQRYSSDH